MGLIGGGKKKRGINIRVRSKRITGDRYREN